MRKQSRLHHGDEFGKPGSSALTGMDAPAIGAASSIMVDALTESESGATPPPPAITVRAIAIALVLVFLGGVVFAALMPDVTSANRPTMSLRYTTAGTGVVSGRFAGVPTRLGLFDIRKKHHIEIRTPNLYFVNGGRDRVPRYAQFTYDDSTSFVLDGKRVPPGEASVERALVTAWDWPVRVQYRRASGKSVPHATAVGFSRP